jgi:hypothetical protein
MPSPRQAVSSGAVEVAKRRTRCRAVVRRTRHRRQRRLAARSGGTPPRGRPRPRHRRRSSGAPTVPRDASARGMSAPTHRSPHTVVAVAGADRCSRRLGWSWRGREHTRRRREGSCARGPNTSTRFIQCGDWANVARSNSPRSAGSCSPRRRPGRAHAPIIDTAPASSQARSHLAGVVPARRRTSSRRSGEPSGRGTGCAIATHSLDERRL